MLAAAAIPTPAWSDVMTDEDSERREFRFHRLGEELFMEFRRLSRKGLPSDEFWTALAKFAVDQWARPQQDGGPVV
jgi:hypothetical protein